MVFLVRPTLTFVSSWLLVGGKFRGYFTGRICRDENVIFFPTMAYEVNETHWEVPVHGWIFEPELDDAKRRAFLSVLRKALKVDSDNAFLKRRVQPFLVDNERWKRPQISMLGETYRPRLSGKNGHFHTSVTVSKESTKHLKDGILTVESVAKDGRKFRGEAHLIPATGLSVISDIDDTIKITNVTDKKSMLRSTFLEDFREVPGMSDVYQRWQREHDAKFHFVSSSPYQLYSDLESFRKRAQFPAATYHLKTIRPKDKSVLNLFADPFKTKTQAISAILEQFPNRDYILVGDSGEKDPEVYGHIARSFPRQIRQICIRNVLPEEDISARARLAFEGIDAEKWKFFDHASELLEVNDASETSE